MARAHDGARYCRRLTSADIWQPAIYHPVSIPFDGKKGGFIAGQAYKFADNPPT